MRANWKYVFAVALLAVLAVVFGLAGTVAPVSEPVSPQQSSSSSSSSVAHFQNPPTYDSEWVNITDKCGQYFNVTHDLNTTEIFVDIVGKQSLSGTGGEHQRNLGGTGITPRWSRTHGGVFFDWAFSVVQTFDGGYVITGDTDSFGAGYKDFWLVKTDPIGNQLWKQTYGGKDWDLAFSVIETSDGGYALAGYTSSFGAGDEDFWLVKTDAFGNLQWSITYGGIGTDVACSVIETSDGGYALAGYTDSFDAGNYDVWLVKTDANGNEQWNYTYGGAGTDGTILIIHLPYVEVVQTDDGGYAFATLTYSFGTELSDFWLVKTNSTGNMQWNYTYGGWAQDWAFSVVQTRDGGYAIAGVTGSFGAGGGDFWLVKTDANGNEQWNYTYGGTDEDRAHRVIETSDGGYALAGYTYSFGAGYTDFWLVKTDAAGNMQWNRIYGGADFDRAWSVVETSDGGYVIAGATRSFGAGGSDFWLVKTGVESGLTWTESTNNTITLYRGRTDLYWNFVRVRIWTIKEPTWQFGDINQDGVVDVQDLYILSQNYGKTFSLLSLGGIVAVAGVHTYKKRKQPK